MEWLGDYPGEMIPATLPICASFVICTRALGKG
jgi:hypothetical protein